MGGGDRVERMVLKKRWRVKHTEWESRELNIEEVEEAGKRQKEQNNLEQGEYSEKRKNNTDVGRILERAKG